MADSLKEYARKRRFPGTPEPEGRLRKGRGPLRFVIQQHDATRLHFDLRLEMEGVYRSWALPKGASLNPSDQKLAVEVESHPIAYGDFEGIIPKGNYGAGTVMIWDRGTYESRATSDRAAGEQALIAGFAAGHITFVLHGEKLKGEFALIRLKDGRNWLLVKKRDEWSTPKRVVFDDCSVVSGRSMAEIAGQSADRGDVWQPRKGRAPKQPKPPPQPKQLPVAGKPAVKKIVAAKMPTTIKLPLPTREQYGDVHDDDIVEELHGGLRAVAFVTDSQVRLLSKAGMRFNARFPEVVNALAKHRGEKILDGWIVTIAKNGALTRPEQKGKAAPAFVVSDLLFLDGIDLRGEALESRLERLHALAIFDNTVRLAVALRGKRPSGTADEFLARTATAPYPSGVAQTWRVIGSASKRADTDRKSIVTHPEKIYFPESGYTKADLISYYETIAPLMLPLLKDRPLSLHRHPDGIGSPGFFHKDLVGYHPRFFSTVAIASASRGGGRSIQYGLCQNLNSLLYLANLGCIELNPWLSRVGSLEDPDYAVIDLDPDDNPFAQVIECARVVHDLLKSLKVNAFLKTSGATGVHIYIPLVAGTSYDAARGLVLAILRVVHDEMPKTTSLERMPARRRHKIYLDAFQNARGQTIAAAYGVRPRPGATVSTPLAWSELKKGLDPDRFTIISVPKRVAKMGDVWAEMNAKPVDVAAVSARLAKAFPQPDR